MRFIFQDGRRGGDGNHISGKLFLGGNGKKKKRDRVDLGGKHPAPR